jgi:hypothetical protein
MYLYRCDVFSTSFSYTSFERVSVSSHGVTERVPRKRKNTSRRPSSLGLVSGHKHHKGLPDGQTLFVPAGTLCSNDFPYAPRYLFRTFDLHSSELSNNIVVASSVSIYSDAETNQLSILSLGKRETSQRMHEHLEKELFGGYPPRNLIGLRKRRGYHNGGRLLRNSKIQRTVLSGLFIVSHGHWVVRVIS